MRSLIEYHPWLLNMIDKRYRKAIDMDGASLERLWNYFIQDYPLISRIADGGFRSVWRVSKDWVVKYPIRGDGVECNLIEEAIYKYYKNTGHYAKCYIKDYKGIPLLFMENIDDFYDRGGNYEFLPAWAHHSDGPQVGYNKNEKLKIYDYGNCFEELWRWWKKRHPGEKFYLNI